jgi:hypothetical protein
MILQNENFNEGYVRKTSAAAAGLAQWVIDMVGGQTSSNPVELVRQEVAKPVVDKTVRPQSSPVKKVAPKPNDYYARQSPSKKPSVPKSRISKPV